VTKHAEDAGGQEDQGAVAMNITLPLELIERIDAWRAVQEDQIEREDAVVRLLISHFWPNL
jgi:hypothetical protein